MGTELIPSPVELEMEQKLKERLTGAVVLILLAVIVIPLLLDDTRRPATGISATNIPEQPEERFTTRLIPILEQDEVLPAGEATEDVPAPVEAEVADATEPATADEPADAAPDMETEVESKGLTGWVVQVGSFARGNADNLNDRLREAGYRSYVVDEPVKAGDGSLLYRVRIGPEVLRSEALKLKAELKKQMKLDGFVLNYP